MKKELKRSLVSKILLTLLAISILNLTACSPKALGSIRGMAASRGGGVGNRHSESNYSQ